MSSFVEITTSANSLAYKLADGRVFEDQISGEMSATNATSSEFIRGQIASIIESGGVSGANNVSSTKMDFTYIAYGVSSTDATKTSAYVYSATYDKSSVLANTAVDSTKLEIAGLAEITDVTQNEISGNDKTSYLRTKPSI